MKDTSKDLIREKNMERLKSLFPKQEFGLTALQESLMSALACSEKERLTTSQISAIVYSYDTKQQSQDLRLLINRGFVHRSYYSWDLGYFVADDIFFRVALNALLYHPDLIEILRQRKLLSSSERFKAVKDLVDTGEVKEFNVYPWNMSGIYDMLLDIYDEPAFEPLFRVLPGEIIRGVVNINLNTLMHTNTADAGKLDAEEAFARKFLTGDMLLQALAAIDGNRYLFNGECGESLNKAVKVSEWPHIVEAISSLYKGDYDAATAHIEQAFKIRNKNVKTKNVFYSSVISYFTILLYILVDNETSRKKLSQYMSKKLDDDWLENNRAARLLAMLSLGYSDALIKGHIRAAYMKDYWITSYILLSAVAKSRGYETGSKAPKSAYAIVRYEAGQCDPAEKERLGRVYGGTPALARIKKKEPWELALEKLSDAIGKNAGSADKTDEPQRDRRICYIVYRDSDVEIREQTRLKSGKWGQGKRAALSSFGDGLYDDISDEYDKKMKSRLNRYTYVSVDEAFPVLAGCDRVFRDTYDPSNRIEIAQEAPYVSVQPKNGHYVFTTNVPLDRYRTDYESENVVCRDKLHYTVICLNRTQLHILNILQETGVKFPETSAEALRSFVEKLSQVIEVHSPLLESGSSLEEKQGSVMLYFRILPKSGAFDALLFTRPLDGGKLTFFPGSGDAVYFDSDDTSRYQVKRDIRAERKALDVFLAKTGLAEYDSEDGLYELSAEDMLPILDACRDLGDICTLEWPEGRSLKVIGSLTPQSINVHIRSKEQWFEMEGDVQLPDGQALTLEQIMSALSSGGYGGGYLKLGESEYVSLSDSLAKYLKRLESVTQSYRGGERISLFQTGILADIVHKSNLNIHTDKAYKEKIAKVDEAASLNPAVPAALKAELRDYQEIGFRWMVRLDHWGAGACLADDMGLGKTVQTIAFLLYKASAGASLVVAPASVLMNWSRELARFAPSLNVIILNESDDRSVALSSLGGYDVVLTTYGLLVREKDALAGVNWNVVCLDEAHTIKNRGTKMSDAAMSLKASSRIILTGTPVQNYLGELWNLFQFLNPGLLGSYESFREKFIAPIENSEDKDRQTQLKRIIQPFMLRRTKSEVVEELPDKTEIYRSVPMSASEQVAYETMRLEAKNELEQDTKVNMNALAAITRLREAACAMALVKNGWTGESSKLAALRELVSEIVSGGNSVLIFSQFTGFLDMASAMLEKDGIEHFYLQGSTPIKKRQEMVSGFQHAEKPVFLISLKAGGLGLNLTGANYVIHLDPWWNPAIEQQATDRAYRIGQQQNVTVYHLVAQNTIEEKILRLHKVKQNLSDAILEGTSTSHAITLDELRELIK